MSNIFKPADMEIPVIRFITRACSFENARYRSCLSSSKKLKPERLFKKKFDAEARVDDVFFVSLGRFEAMAARKFYDANKLNKEKGAIAVQVINPDYFCACLR